MTKKILEESEAQVEALKEILKNKEREISEAKCQLYQAKEDAVRDYRNSDALLKELGGSFANGFDNCFHQVRASFPELDLSHVSIDAQAQTPAQPVYSEGTMSSSLMTPIPTTRVTEMPARLSKKNPSR